MREYNNFTNWTSDDELIYKKYVVNKEYVDNSIGMLDKVLQQYTIEEIIDKIGIEKVENIIRMKKLKRIIG